MGGHHHHYHGGPAQAYGSTPPPNDNAGSSDSSTYPEINYSPGAKWIKNLTRDRLSTFTGGHFSGSNLSSVLFIHRLDDASHVSLKVWSASGLTKPSFQEAMKQTFKDAKKGDSFGPSWSNHWWKVSVKIPEYWKAYERVQFEFDPGCEAMIFDLDGTPLQGITGGFGGDRRVEYIIPLSAREKGTHEFIIESSCNGMFGVPWNGDSIEPPDMNRYFSLASADLVVPNQEAWRLLWDFTTLRELVDNVEGNRSLQNLALVTANEMMNVFNPNEPSSVTKARKIAERVFGEGWEEKSVQLYENDEKRARVWGIGHCHIDTAWLWPFSVTQQKVARSWSTQVDLMERYPEHRFACSSAQQYKWLEQLYPRLFSAVSEKIASGKFHPIGGSWVENDGNMPSGEALARQMIFGQRFFISRFGVRCRTAWLPDSFGLTGAYPQLIRSAGMKYFFTQKLSWNNVNVFPHTTFNWVGIDGTPVLCHMTPVDTYTAQATVGDIRKGVLNHKNIESSDTALLVFGNGDGGGGPLPKMLENLRRIRAVAEHSTDIPVVSMGNSVDEFFEDFERDSKHGKTLPNWHGELYLEFHRGTYTSHGSIKRGNRKSEILMRDLELVATLASVLPSPASEGKYVYPKNKIDESWEKVLLCQFHDVLPGSSIGMVYDDAEKLYAEIAKDGKQLLEEAFSALFPKSTALPSSSPYSSASNITKSLIKSSSIPSQGKLFAFNTTPFARRDVVEIPLGSTGSGARLRGELVQSSGDGKVGYALMETVQGTEVRGVGVSMPRGLYADCSPPSVYMSGSSVILKNSTVQLTIDDGRITSLVDVQLQRELLFPGQTGGLVIFDDRPNYWDAWDVEIHHLETRKELTFSGMKIVASGPLRAAVEAEVKYGKSTIKVTIALDAITATTKPDSRSLFLFDAQIDWKERHKFLKFDIPLDIRSGTATYETQFGNVQRPTHKNTTWDAAKFEVCGHKYADLSEYGYGVAFLSESKYGFSCQGNVLSISLLRSATAPDAEQDQGEHRFAWAVMPHLGHFLQSDVPQAAYIFNSPLHMRVTSGPNDNVLNAISKPPFSLYGAHNVVLETVKRGDDDDFGSHSALKQPKSIALRIYEAFGGHARVFLRVSADLHAVAAYQTNLLEDLMEAEQLNFFRANECGLSVEDDDDVYIQLNFRAFEVKTIKIQLSKEHSEKSKDRDSWVSVKSALLG